VSRPDLAVIIVNFDTAQIVGDCLRSIDEARDELELEIFVIDNGSVDGSVAHIREQFPWVALIENPTNRGFGAANNQGLERCTAPFALLLNSDTQVYPGALRRMLEVARERSDAAIVSCKLVDANGAPQPSASSLPELGLQAASFLGLKRLLKPGRARTLVELPFVGPIFQRLTGGYFVPLASLSEPIQVEFVSGACMMVRREFWETVGGFDEELFLYLEDADWCRRAKESGWKLYFVPDVAVLHLGGQSFMRTSGGRTYHISSERLTSLFYYFRKHEPGRVPILKSVVMLSLAVRYAVARLRRKAGDAALLLDLLRVVRRA
jgi:GT2 family glycosyltransferase